MPLDIDALNPAQREAVVTTEGPLLVLAGAGSGKTRVLTYRIAHLIEDLGVPPWQILAITFTNKAAREMRDRLDGLLGGRSMRGMWVSTFHAMCIRMLRIDCERIGYSKNFAVYDDDDSKRLMKSIMADLHIDEKTMALNAIRSRISTAKNELLSPDEMLADAKTPPDRTAAKAYAELQVRLRRANAMDFDDLLMNAHVLLRDNPDVLDGYQERFRYISVDEYQDTNRAQYEICRLLAAKHQNIMVVGDDDQSIYSWRGADIRNILDFEKDYPRARTVKLEQNYRSTGHILEAANAVVANNTERKSKRLFTAEGDGEKIKLCQKPDETAEANYIAGEIRGLRDRGTRYRDIAVFYRTNAQSRALEDGLVKAGIPYTIVGGTRFFDRAEIRDVMAYLKLVLNPNDDVSAMRVVNKPARSIGATTQERISAIARDRGISFFEAACAYVVEEPGVPTRTRNGIIRFLQIIGDARSYEGELASVVEMIVERTGLIEALRNEDTDEARDRIENIREFVGVVKEYVANHQTEAQDMLSNAEVAELSPNLGESGAPAMPAVTSAPAVSGEPAEGGQSQAGDLDLAGFMEWLALRTDLDAASTDGDNVTLMTVHAAKGLEFDTVFVAGMEETVFPHVFNGTLGQDQSKIEEKRRLAYVAITRARRRLYLCYARMRRLFGQEQHNPLSRFVNEIPAEHVTYVGVGSDGYEGFGYDRRGSRHGIGGAGHNVEVYDGNVFGNRTRSSGASATASGRSAFSSGRPSASGRSGVSFDSFVSSGSSRSGFSRSDSGLSSGSSLGSSRASSRSSLRDAPAPQAPTRQYERAEASTSFAPGDRVNHKKFGTATVVRIEGDKITIHLDSGGEKVLLKGYAPIVKIKG